MMKFLHSDFSCSIMQRVQEHHIYDAFNDAQAAEQIHMFHCCIAKTDSLSLSRARENPN